MNTARVSSADFIVERIVGSIVVEESGPTGAEGRFTIAGRYREIGVVRCLRASGRFSTRP
jgi:hypothetical protein